MARYGYGYGYGYGGSGFGFREYVPVGQRIAQAKKFAAARARKQKRQPEPVSIAGRNIAKTFWGKAWCDHMESFSDYANRLPRGRTYVRNGSVVDLQISKGRLKAIVGGSEVYQIDVKIDPLKPAVWKKIRSDCSQSIDSLLDLLAGRFSDGVMKRLTDRKQGMFPSPKEIHLKCSCPDWADLCKHLAAVLYGVGAHLDHQPELLFLLRGVDHTELVGEAVSAENLDLALGSGDAGLEKDDLGAMFGIELDDAASADSSRTPRPKRKAAGRKKAAGKTGKGTSKGKTSRTTTGSKTSAKKAAKSTKKKKNVPKSKAAAKKTTSARKATSPKKKTSAKKTTSAKKKTSVEKKAAGKTTTAVKKKPVPRKKKAAKKRKK
ncbi:MAG: SWIM zinc finger family protein [Fuerstiella sp.]